MPSTPAGLPYPDSLVEPNVPHDIQQLALALDPTVTDTGWVDITSSLASGVTGTVFARKVGPTVEVRLHNITVAAGGSLTFLTLPSAFTSAVVGSTSYRAILHTAASGIAGVRVSVTGNTCAGFGFAAGVAHFGTWRFFG